MKVELRHNPSSTVARCVLAGGEPVRVEAGAMVAHSAGMTLEARAEVPASSPPPTIQRFRSFATSVIAWCSSGISAQVKRISASVRAGKSRWVHTQHGTSSGHGSPA